MSQRQYLRFKGILVCMVMKAYAYTQIKYIASLNTCTYKVAKLEISLEMNLDADNGRILLRSSCHV